MQVMSLVKASARPENSIFTSGVPAFCHTEEPRMLSPCTVPLQWTTPWSGLVMSQLSTEVPSFSAQANGSGLKPIVSFTGLVTR